MAALFYYSFLYLILEKFLSTLFIKSYGYMVEVLSLDILVFSRKFLGGANLEKFFVGKPSLFTGLGQGYFGAFTFQVFLQPKGVLKGVWGANLA